jgi:hypothetical protein
MIYDKKPSVYSDRGTIGSAEELDAYGVWVKSEPQDMVAGLAGAADYANETYEADYDTGFSIPESEASDADVENYDDNGISESNFADDSFDYDNSAGSSFINNGIGGGPGLTGEVSTQLLMKIADELSSIRSELTSLKKEFADIRAETGTVAKAPAAKETTRHSDFFEEDEDEKITLTGDELNNILSSANLTSEDALSFDSLRDEDEAALSEISDQNEMSVQDAVSDMAADAGTEEEAEDELIDIDFDNLGIDLTYTEEPEPSEQALLSEDKAALDDFEQLPTDEIPAPQESEDPLFPVSEMEEITELSNEAAAIELREEISIIDTSEDADELRSLRIEGAAPLTPPPDESEYLEADPFPLNDSGLDDLSSSDNSLELNLNETGFDLALDDFSDDTGASIEEIPDEIQSLEDPSLDTFSTEETIFEETPLETMSLEEAPLEDDSEFTFEETALDEMSLEETSSELEFLEEATLDESSLEEPDGGAFEESFSLEESPLDEMSFEETSLEPVFLEEASMEETPEETPMEEASLDEPSDTLTLDESSETFSLGDSPLDEMSFEETSSEPVFLEETPVEETPVEEAPADYSLEETPLEAAASLDLSEAIIDEPDLSAEIAETPLEEPSLSDITLEMDDFDLSTDFDVKDDEFVEEPAADEFDSEAGMVITSKADDSLNGELTTNGVDDKSIDFALDDFGEGFDLDAKTDDFGVVAYSDEKEDSIAQVIPEGFEVNAEEAAISLDDDLEDDLSIEGEEIDKPELTAKAEEAPAGENLNIPVGLKTELKNVLSYMDHLLESLPEEKIEEFAKSDYFDAYKKLFKDLGLA